MIVSAVLDAPLATDLRADPVGPRGTASRVDLDLLGAVERFTFAAVAETERALAVTPGAAELTLPQWRVLSLLFRASRPFRLGQVASAVGLSMPSASRMVARLAARRLVGCASDSRDRRALRIRLTPAGRRIVRAALAARDDRYRRALAGVQLPPAFAAQLEAVAAALLESNGDG